MKITDSLQLLSALRSTGTSDRKITALAGLVESHFANTGKTMTSVELYNSTKKHAEDSRDYGYELTLSKMQELIVTGQYVPSVQKPVNVEERLARKIAEERTRPEIAGLPAQNPADPETAIRKEMDDKYGELLERSAETCRQAVVAKNESEMAAKVALERAETESAARIALEKKLAEIEAKVATFETESAKSKKK